MGFLDRHDCVGVTVQNQRRARTFFAAAIGERNRLFVVDKILVEIQFKNPSSQVSRC
jgi:hypothetical protein